jgi:hypothetical protein
MSLLKKLHSLLNSIFRPSHQSWWELFLIAALLAIGAAAWPAARCAVADCSKEDKWCNGNCSQSCGPVTGVGFVASCYIQAGQCRQRWYPDRIQVTCKRDGDCAFDSVSKFRSRMNAEGYWNVGACGKFPRCNPLVKNVDFVTCCKGGSASNSGAPACTPSFDPPTLNLASISISPSHPLVIGQDPDRLGVDVGAIAAQGGLRHCPDDGSRGKITGFSVQVALSSASQAWILGDLRLKYPGAEIKGAYPFQPQPNAFGLQSSSASLSFHFDPLDPGTYAVTINVTQEDGKTATGTLAVPVWLLEGTLTQ